MSYLQCLKKLRKKIFNTCVFYFRYQFKNGQKVALQEIGPRFTLRLKWVQAGTFDTKYGEYEWVLKVSIIFVI